MKRIVWALVVLLGIGPLPARGEDFVSVMGNYYKERSTRVIAPRVTVQKELPSETQLSVAYTVDQITSASGAFTNEDAVFHEYRNEVQAGVSHPFGEIFTPGVDFRISYEGDYTSWAVGSSLQIDLPNDLSSAFVRLQYQLDSVRQRGRSGFNDELETVLVGVGWTQVLHQKVIGGLSANAQINRGFQENPYRVEQHPRCRDRYVLGGWLSYREPSTRTTARFDYEVYTDTWELTAHNAKLEVWQRITPWLEVIPMVRFHTQSGVFFTNLTTTEDPCAPDGNQSPDNDLQLITRDPKLFPMSTWSVGSKVVVTLPQLWNIDLVAAYYYYTQPQTLTRTDGDLQGYGPAHIAQAGFYLPF